MPATCVRNAGDIRSTIGNHQWSGDHPDVQLIDPYLSLLTDELVEGKVSDPYFRRSIVSPRLVSRIVGTVMAQFLLVPAALWIVTVAEWL